MFISPSHHQAVVIGGGMAGMLAARVLAEVCERVTIVERDRFPAGPTARKGLPQARHVHVLLKRGEEALEHFFPGLGEELAASGAPLIDWIADCQALGNKGWLPRFSSGILGHLPSRDLLDWSIRRRLARHEQIHWLEAHDAVGLLSNAEQSAIVGVRVRPRNEAGQAPGEAYDLSAALVVDASGRDSPTPNWLAALGYPRPQETVIASFLGYASRFYQRPVNAQMDWKVLLLPRKLPAIAHGGVLYAQEGGRWIVTLSGTGHDCPPTDGVGFLTFAQTLASPALYQAIKDAEPCSPICGSRQTGNRLRHYERLTRWPEGLVVLGDAVCVFNPIFSQGMTVAALGAETLEQALRAHQRCHPDGDLTGLARRFQQALAQVTAPPWEMATSEDSRAAETQDSQANHEQLVIRRYSERLRALASENQQVYRTLLEVSHLLKPASALLQPDIARQVLGRTAGTTAVAQHA